MNKYCLYILSCLASCAAVNASAQPLATADSSNKNIETLHHDAALEKQITLAPVDPADTLNYTINLINVTGNKRTKTYIVLRECQLTQGETYTLADIKTKATRTRELLMNTTLFVDVIVTPVQLPQQQLQLDIVVKERWYLFPLPYFKLVDRNINQWWVEHNRDLDRVNYGIKFTQYNFSGRNDKLNVWLINGYTQQISAGYDAPFIDKSLKHGMSFGFFYSQNREVSYKTEFNKQKFNGNVDNDFIRRRYGGSFTYSYRPKINTRHFFSLSYENERVADTILALNPNYFPSLKNSVGYPSISYSLSYNNVDYLPYPTKGWTYNASFTKRGINKNMNLWQVGGTVTYTRPVLDKKTFLHLQAAGTLLLPFKQPFYNKRIFGYGALYMRGLEYYVSEGVAAFMARATLRKQVLKFTVKNLVKSKSHDRIPFTFYAKVFGDIGYAYDDKPQPSSFLNNKLLRTAGVGIDVISIYDFVLKLEFSVNQFGDKGLFVHGRGDF